MFIAHHLYLRMSPSARESIRYFERSLSLLLQIKLSSGKMRVFCIFLYQVILANVLVFAVSDIVNQEGISGGTQAKSAIQVEMHSRRRIKTDNNVTRLVLPGAKKEFGLSSDAFDFDAAYAAAWLSQLSYHGSLPDAPTSTDDNYGCNDIMNNMFVGPYIPDYATISCDSGMYSWVRWIVGYSNINQAIYITFRGTDNLKNLMIDAAVLTTSYPFCPPDYDNYFTDIFDDDGDDDCQVHLGMITAYNEIAAAMWDSFRYVHSYFPSYTITVTGHSLGGGIATLAAADLFWNGYKNLRLISFESPRVFNGAAANYWTSQFPFVYRFTHCQDIFVRIPGFATYLHIAGEVFVDCDGSWYLCSGQDNPYCADKYSSGGLSTLLYTIQDISNMLKDANHPITSYIEASYLAQLTHSPTPYPTYQPYGSGSCAATCSGYSCDAWTTVGYSCYDLEITYGCDCSGCSLCPTNHEPTAEPSMAPTSAPTEYTGCVNTNCYGYTCNYWVAGGNSCYDLEKTYGCDCSGCSLCPTNHEPTIAPALAHTGPSLTPTSAPTDESRCTNSNCYGHTCAYWASYGFSCDDLTNTYGCDCSGCTFCAPTAAPTAPPTVSPTRPTATPTKLPSLAPTVAPTVAPTCAPTVAPTAKPTPAPTERPTNSPAQITTTTSITQTFSGVSEDVKNSPTLTAKLASSIQAGVASVLNVPVTDVSTPTITYNTMRRNLLTSYAATAQYSVTTANTASSSIQSSLASQSGTSQLSASLSSSGFSGLTPQSPVIATMTPTLSPTATAISAATSSGSSGGNSAGGCFSSADTVHLDSGESILISEVVLGDRILTVDANGKQVYSPVIAVPHKKNDIQAQFVRLVTESGREVSMTPLHMIPAGSCPRITSVGTVGASASALSLVYASTITTGDCILTTNGLEKVVEVKKAESRGIYTVVTQEEFVVINGVVASPFAISHVFANVYYNVLRIIHAYYPAVFKIPTQPAFTVRKRIV